MPQKKVRIAVRCQYCERISYFKPSIAKSRRWCNSECRRLDGEKKKKYWVSCSHPNCNNEFQTYKSNPQKYCSISCGVSFRNLTEVNPSYHRDLSGENNPMFGKGHLISGKKNPMYGMRGPKNPAWKGGKRSRPDGYIRIIAPDDHPHPSEITRNGLKYILEHRLIMENEIGRYLLHDEVVHHIDGDPSNNDKEQSHIIRKSIRAYIIRSFL